MLFILFIYFSLHILITETCRNTGTEIFAAQYIEIATLMMNDPFGNSQSQTSTTGFSGTAFIGAIESIKIYGKSSGTIPIPLSCTCTAAMPSRAIVFTEIRPCRSIFDTVIYQNSYGLFGQLGISFNEKTTVRLKVQMMMFIDHLAFF